MGSLLPSGGPVLISLLYLAAGWLAWTNADAVNRRESSFWRASFAALIVLAINKLFEGPLTHQARALAIEHGWYAQRQTAQIEVIVFVAISCLIIAGVLLFLTKTFPAATQIALVGVLMLLGFGIIRDASLHQLDDLIARRIIGLKVNWILELAGIALVLSVSEWRCRLTKRTMSD